MKIFNITNIFIISAFCTLTFTNSVVSTPLTKEQCEQTCSDQKCRTKIWGPCHQKQTACPANDILKECEACRNITPELVQHCWNIYQHGESYQGQ